MPPTWPAPAWLRCSACGTRLRRDPLCSDLGVLALHWMSQHPARWLELHPEDRWFLEPGVELGTLAQRLGSGL
jgi:hypothetical protein